MSARTFALTPRLMVNFARLAAAFCGVGMAVLMLGPYQGLERIFGLGDKPAHAIAFFGVTTGLFLVLPAWRRGDLAMLTIGAAVLSELAQGLTGRSMSLTDLVADGAGVMIALAPGLIEHLRWMRRAYPDVPLSEIGARDRRTRTGKPAAKTGLATQRR